MAFTGKRLLSGPLLIDGHVHIHGALQPGMVLTHAAANFLSATRRSGLDHAIGVLALAELSGDEVFRRLASGDNPAGWHVQPTHDGISLIAISDSAKPTLLIIAGRQLATHEGLEILALGTNADLPDGSPLATTVAAVLAENAVPVIPWGFGKWWFRRGRLVRELVAASAPGAFLLGDNGGRPVIFPRPGLYRCAEARGVAILPGSDPLALPKDWMRVGSFGFSLDMDLGYDRPGEDFLDVLRGLRESPAEFGSRIGLTGFVTNQIGLRIGRRTGYG
jgi:hypothetical protein